MKKVAKTSRLKADAPKSKATQKAEKLLGGPVRKTSDRLKEQIADKSVPLKAKKQATAKLKEKLAPTNLLQGKDPAKVKVPKSLSECVDLYEEARRRRLEIAKSAEGFGELEKLLREHLINNVSKSDAAGVTGRTHRVQIKLRAIPRIEDESAFRKAAKRKGNEDLIKEVPNEAAIKERWDAGKAIPGVTSFDVVTLSLNKL